MAKRSREIEAVEALARPDKMLKVERSHQQNQERAYIAASRRTDRGIEARVESARMASAIHKKRTGRGFKISEDIVVNQDMYEEEEDGRHSRRYPALSGQRSADWALTRHQQINALFATHFPNSQQIACATWPPGVWLGNTNLSNPLGTNDPTHPAWHSTDSHQGEEFQSNETQSSASKTPLSLTTLHATPEEEELSVPTLTPSSVESDPPSDSTLLSPVKQDVDDFPAVIDAPGETLHATMRGVQFPTENCFTSNSDLTDLSFYDDCNELGSGVPDTLTCPSTTSAQTVAVKPGELPHAPCPVFSSILNWDSDELDAPLSAQSNSWADWLDPDMFPSSDGKVTSHA